MELVPCLNSLSLVARSEGNVDRALGYLDDAISNLPSRGFARTRIRLLINRGVCLLKLGKLPEARSMFLKAQAALSEPADHVYQVMVFNNLGHLYRLQGNHSVAKDFHVQALSLARSESSTRQICLSLEFLGETCADEGDALDALRYLNEAHEHAMAIAKHGDVMMEILRRRGEVHAMRNDMGAAVVDLQRAIELCGSRGEKREAVLARRAYWLVASPDVEDLAIRMREVLRDLDQLADRFEYARTVYLILKDARLDAEKLPWLADAVVAATHYFTVLGSKVWKARLQEVSGHQRRINRTRAEQDPLQGYHVASRSPAFGATLDAVRVASRSRFPALIVGETGAGKEIVAQLLHQTSERAGIPLIAINCGALPEALVESELFGYAAGAFTGAAREKPGLFEAAHKGTVLMDEIGDLPLMAQVKVLRFLDTGEVRRVGEVRSRRCDVRVVASTNRDLETLVQEGRFRSDLLFRLQAFRIRVPSLRERPEDVLDLARVFLREAAERGDVPSLSPDLEGWMLGYEWPGNVRELRNLCGYMHAQAWGRAEILLSDLPPEYRSRCSGTQMSPFDRDLVEFERTRIAKALKESRGSISGAAKLLGMSRNTVSQRMRKFGLAREAFEI